MKRTVSDVMTRSVVSVDAFTPFKEIVRRMQERRVSAVPVVDEDGCVLGVVSEADLLLKEDPDLEGGPKVFEGVHRRRDRARAAGLVASELMSAPAITVAATATIGDAARLMHRREVKRLPVVDASDGRIVGIVSRADLLKVFLRSDEDIAHEIREDVIRRTLWIDPATIRIVVRSGIVTAEGQVERRSLIAVLERLVLATEGVVAFESRLGYAADDITPPFDVSGSWPAPYSRAGR
jgi:CBS-domain-containing membrane protein